MGVSAVCADSAGCDGPAAGTDGAGAVPASSVAGGCSGEAFRGTPFRVFQ